MITAAVARLNVAEWLGLQWQWRSDGFLGMVGCAQARMQESKSIEVDNGAQNSSTARQLMVEWQQ